MFLRALILLTLVAGASLTLSYVMGAEVLAALGMVIAQAKIVIAKVFSVTWRGILVWLQAQGMNFARVEIAKRYVYKSLLPMILGAAFQRQIAGILGEFKARVLARYTAMMDWYRALPKPVRIVGILIAMFGMLLVALSSVSVWLLLFSVQLPFWIIAITVAFGNMIWQSVQKLLFRTVAFMKLYRIWGFLRDRLPADWLARKRRFDFRVARIVVKRRKLTLQQLQSGKDGLSLRWALLREYFRHERPMPKRDCDCPPGQPCYCRAPAE